MFQPTVAINRDSHWRELNKQDAKLKRLLQILRNNQTDSDYFRDTLSAIITYAKWHFSNEESRMKKLKYPGFQQHQNEHEFFLRTATLFYQDLMQKKTDSTHQFIKLLDNWVEKHFDDEDTRLNQFIRQAECSGCY